jgi:hypothetical protein
MIGTAGRRFARPSALIDPNGIPAVVAALVN